MSRSRQSIHRQVLLFTLLICATILLFVGCILFYHHLSQTRERLAASVGSTAQIIATNASAAVAFRDEVAAADILGSLRHDPLIASAALYDAEGERFATYGAPTPEIVDLADTTSTHESFRVPIRHRGETYGLLLLTSDQRAEMRRTNYTWGGVYLVAFGLAGLSAFVLAGRFRRAVAAPLVELARTAADVTSRGDYTVRARPGGCAEVNTLAENLNLMLAEVGRRDRALARQLQALDREIAERSAAEETLRQNHHEMLRLSHAAGMAEVAAGVLHNIGNTLNSINVSAELLATHLHSRAGSSAVALRDFFGKPHPKAAPVFAAHPDGPDVLEFAASLSAHVSAQLASAERELASLRTGVAHLKDIVARQQTLAKSARQHSLFDIHDAVHDALTIDKTADHLPPDALVLAPDPATTDYRVYADRGAVVQILINLLANARAALASAAPALPRLTIRLGPPGDTLLPLAIEDNGVGIPAEQLLSIFSYGFTTKAGGHGFGLHNAANTARLLGGSLSVHSPGPGHGATFTLALPRHPPSSDHDA